MNSVAPSTVETTPQTCPKCGQPIPGDAPGLLCPRCLVAGGFTESRLGTQNDQHPDSTLSLVFAEETPLPPGAPRKLGDYEIVEVIARGGMGIVYKAWQPGLERFVAIKTISSGLLATRIDVERFQREAKLAARLRHPNIVSIHEIGEQEGQHFFAMDYVSGENLAALARKQPFLPEQAAQIVTAIAEAVHYAHQQGVLHRDLKPANVILSPDGPRVLDFGLARLQQEDSELTQTGAPMGSPCYMPPEQAAGKRGSISPQSDVYALGAILYELLIGRPPFQAASVAETIRLVHETDPITLRRINPALPADLETISLKCLEKDPSRRYQSAQEVADELQRFLRDEPIHARPVSALEKFRRWCLRKPALATSFFLILILALILIIGSPLAAYRINQARQVAQRAAKSELALREKAQAEAYTADMNNVMQAWEEGNLSRAQALLTNYIPKHGERDYRGYEWRYLWRICQDESLRTLSSPSGSISRLASSPYHSFVAACADSAVLLLDPKTGAEFVRLPYPNASAPNSWHSIDLASGATNLLATHRAEGWVLLWDISRRELLKSFRASTNRVVSLALSPDGKLLATGDDSNPTKKICIWDISATTDAPIRPRWSTEVALRPTALGFSPDGSTLVANSRPFAQGTLQAWDAKTGEDLPPFPKRSVGWINAIAFSPDGSFLATSGIQSRINIWHLESRSVKFYFEGHQGIVNSLKFSPDGRTLISAGNDSSIRFWDMSTRQSAGMLRSPGEHPVASISYSPDGQFIFTSTENELKVWNSKPRPLAMEYDIKTEWPIVSFSPDGRWVVCTGYAESVRANRSTAIVRDASTFEERFILTLTNRQTLQTHFSPDGKYFAIGGEDRVVAIWDTSTWGTQKVVSPIVYLPHEFESGAVAFSADSKLLAVTGMSFAPDKPSHALDRLAFWEVGAWKKLNLLPAARRGTTERDGPATVAFARDNRLVAIGYGDGKALVWDFRTGTLVEQLQLPAGQGAGVNFAENSLWLGVASETDSTILLVNLAEPAPRRIHELKSLAGTWNIVFDPENKTAVSSGDDGVIRCWSLEIFKLALTLRHGHGPGGSVAFTPDGDTLCSRDAHGVVKFWSALPLTQINNLQRPNSQF